MGLDIWFKEDIRNVLLAANEASASAMAVARVDSAEARAYREGFVAALVSVALAFGLGPEVVLGGRPGEEGNILGRRRPNAVGLLPLSES